VHVRVPVPLLLAALPFLASCGDRVGQAAAARPVQAVPVSIAPAEVRDVGLRLQAVGTVQPLATVDVRPQVGGVLAQAAFVEGADVKAGDVLFRIDDRPFVNALRQAQAALARDRALAVAAARDAARYEVLAQKNYASQEDRDRLRSQADGAKASVALDEAAVDQARLQVSYCTIRSPIDGRTGPILVKPGNVVQANTTELVTVHRLRPIHAAFPVPESRLPEVRARMAAGAIEVLARPEGDPGEPIPGRLVFLGNEVDRGTGTFLLKAAFDNQDGRLWPGQFVRVTATLGVRAKATVVPSAAVSEGQVGSYLFALKADDTADLRKVVTGPADDGVTVIESGVEPGDRIVVDGQVRLAPGAKVEIRP